MDGSFPILHENRRTSMASNTQWLNLTNPFKTGGSIIGHISGRRTDIIEITSSQQSAIILAGAPKIGKSTLVHYLQDSASQVWTWRDELADLRQHLYLNDIHFVYVDLTPTDDMAKNI